MRSLAFPRLVVVLLALALAGCAAFGPSQSEMPLPLDDADTQTTRGLLEVATIGEDRADWNGALARVDKALVLQPRSRTALLRRAQLLLVADLAGGAPADLEDVREILAEAAGGDDPELLLVQALLDTKEGRPDAAREAALRAADAGPESARVQWLAARVFALQGDAAESLAAAERAMTIDARVHAAQRERARARMRSGDFENALIDVGAQLRTHPGDFENSEIEGEIFWRTANFERARRAYEAIPADRRSAAAHAAIGWLSLRARAADAARSALEAGLAAFPTDARVLEALLAVDEREKRLGDSIARLDAAAAARPDDAAIARVRARALALGQHPDDAAAAFGRALALAPEDAATYEAIAAWLGAATPEDADLRITQLGANAAPTRVAQGSVRAARGDRAGAIAAFRQAIDADPSLVIARAQLARALATAGQELDRAVTLAREASAARPSDPDVAWALGVAQLRRGHAEPAFHALRAAAGSLPPERPGYGEIFLLAAIALEDQGERASARSSASIALAHAGDRSPAPGWKATAQSIHARLAPAPRRTEAPQQATGAPSANESASAPSAAPSANESDAPPSAESPSSETPAAAPSAEETTPPATDAR